MTTVSTASSCERLPAFLREFVFPLVAGGDLRVGEPVTPDELAAWEVALGEATVELDGIDAVRAQVLAPLVVRPPAVAFGVDELRLAVALHDALVLAHPDADGWGARAGARAALHAFARELAAAPPPEDRVTLLGRHGLLHRLFDVCRVDVRLSWWTGKAEFRGQDPPRRLVAWRGVRRVSEERETVPLDELVAAGVPADVLTALLGASPLTDLLAPARAAPPFSWQPGNAALLRDAELVRAVAYRWLGPHGVHGGEHALGDHAVAAAAAFLAALGDPSLPPADVRAVAALLVHLLVLVATEEALGRVPPEATRLRSAIAAASGASPPAGLRELLVLPDALAEVEPALAGPAELRDAGDDAGPRRGASPDLAARWRAHRADCAPLADVREALAVRLAAAFRP